MNKVILCGRLTSDAEVRYGQGENSGVARYTLAVDRRYKKDGESDADFIRCVAFGRQAEFVEKYLRKGMKVAIVGRIQTGSYTDKNGNKVYTTDIAVEEHEFCESKATGQEVPKPVPSAYTTSSSGDFMYIPDGVNEELPFE